MVMTDLLEEFHHAGFVRLPGAVPAEAIRAMYDRLWVELERKGAQPDDPASWRERRGHGLQAIRDDDPSPRDSTMLRDALDAVFAGRPFKIPDNWGQALVTFPTPGIWDVPHRLWHFDHFHRRPGDIAGVNLLLFVDDVEAGGGGTVAVRSSPALMERYGAAHPDLRSMNAVNKGFARHNAWLEALTGDPSGDDRCRRFMARDTDLDGIAVRVAEFTGKAGDVMLCHPGLFHAPAPNVRPRPRLMRAQRIRRIDP